MPAEPCTRRCRLAWKTGLLEQQDYEDQHRQCSLMQVYQQTVVSNNAIWALGSGLLSK